ncbi:MAG: hypothetical protein RR721_20395 [Aeromonas sp.]|uniref:hypothetical protein n=1 Tax=Aeromonas sp. TaxID=647 RepID=UPI002FCB16A7
MYWPDTQTGVDVEPARKPVASAVRKFFTEGGLGQAPTVPGGDWFNQITNELLNVLAAAGIDPSKADDDQLLQAINGISKAPSAREALRLAYAKFGYILRPEPEDFRRGGVLTSPIDVLLDENSGKAYSHPGPYPKTVDEDTNPVSGGFIDRSELLPGIGVVRDGKFALRDFVSLADFIPSSADKNYLADADFARAIAHATANKITNILLPSNMVFKLTKTSLNKNIVQNLRIYCDRPAVYDENSGGTIWTDSDRVFDVGIDDGNPDTTGFTRSVVLENLQLGRVYDPNNAASDTSDVAVNVVNTTHFKMNGCRTFGFKNGGVRPEGGNVIVDIDDLESYGLTGKTAAIGYGYAIAKPTKYWGNFVLRIRNLHGFQYKGLMDVGKGRALIIENPVAENMQDSMFAFSGADHIYSLSISKAYGELIPGAFLRDNGFIGVIYNLIIDGLEAHEAGAGSYSPVLSTLHRGRVLHVTSRGIVCSDAMLDAQLGTTTLGRLVDSRLFPTGSIMQSAPYDDDLFKMYSSFRNEDILGLSGNFSALDAGGTAPYGWIYVNGLWATAVAPVQSGASLKCTTGGNFNKATLDVVKPAVRTRYAMAVTHNGPIAVKVDGTVVFSTTAAGWKTDIYNIVVDTTAATMQITVGPVTNAGDPIELADMKMWKIDSADATEVGWTSGLTQKAIRMSLNDVA